MTSRARSGVSSAVATWGSSAIATPWCSADAPNAADTVKAEGGESASAAPKNYSRGEGQKPVTQAYKDNWNAIFAKKKKR